MFQKAAYVKILVVGLTLAMVLLIQTIPVQAQSTDGNLDVNFNPALQFTNFNGLVPANVLALYVQSDGKILVAGDFTHINGVERPGVARLNENGSLDTSFVPNGISTEDKIALAVQPDGKILVGDNYGDFFRLNANNGELDVTFNPYHNNESTYIAVQEDGKILIGGDFSRVNGNERAHIARLNADGTLDTTFTPIADDDVTVIRVQPDGKILIGGYFTKIDGVPRKYIARLNADGSLDQGFDPGAGANDVVWTIALQSDSKILIGGWFSAIDGVSQNAIARLEINGTLDPGFRSVLPATSSIDAIALQPDGKILVGGYNSEGNTSGAYMARMEANGALDSSFVAGKGIDYSSVEAISLQSGSTPYALIGGTFESYNGVARTGLARLHISYANQEIALRPDALQFPTEVEGSSNPPAQMVMVNNSKAGAGSIEWTAHTDAEWLLVSPGHGHTNDQLLVQPDIAGLAPGLYSGHVIVESAGELVANSPQTVTVALEIVPQNSNVPILRVNSPSLGFQAVENEGNPPSQTFTVENIGGGALNWTASISADAQSWLALSQTSGAAPATVTAAANINGLSPGVHVGQILIQDAQGGRHTIVVVLTITPGPTIGLDPSTIVFTARRTENNPPDQSFQVENLGAGSFTWQASENIPWLVLGANSGSSPATVNASADIGGLASGRYTGQVAVTSATAANSPSQVDAILGVLAGPILNVDVQRLDYDVVFGEGNPAPGQIEIRNVGAADLDWRIEEDIPWLSLNQISGVLSGHDSSFNVQASIDVTGLPVGDYTGQITVYSDNGEASPQTINVTLTVFSPAEYCRFADGKSGKLIDTSKVKLILENTKTVVSATGCELSGELRLYLGSQYLQKNARLSAPISGSVNLDNKLTAKASGSGLFLEVANLRLRLADEFTVEEEIGLVVNSGQWNLPDLFGGGVKGFNGTITIGPQGVSIAGSQTFDLPDLNWGSSQFIKNKATIILSGDDEFIVNVTSGEMKVGVSGSPAATAKNVTIQLDRKGIRKGDIGRFTVPSFAGLSLEILSATIGNNEMQAQETRLIIPKEWGGADASFYNLRIKKSGDVTLGGARLKLPSIKAGNFQLFSLEGGLRPLDGGGYMIIAAGAFGLPSMSGSGSCRMNVAVTLRTGPNGASILTVDSADQNAPQPVLISAPQNSAEVNGLRLDEFTVGIHCRPGIAIASTGFQLTGVEGTVRLVPGEEKVKLTLWIETYTQVGTKPAVSAVPSATIYSKPFHVEFDADVYIAGLKTSRNEALIERRRFKYGMTFDYTVVHGNIALEAGVNSGRFYFEGSGKAEVGVRKGSILSECVRFIGCANVPDSNITVANADAWINLEGLRGAVRVWKYSASFYFDFRNGSLRVPAATRSRLITGAEAATAYQTWLAVQQGQVAAAALDGRFNFGPDNTLLVNTPITLGGPEVKASNVITDYKINMRRDVVFMMVQPSTGALEFRIHTPSGLEISRNYLETCTPNADAYCSNVIVEQVAGAEGTQTIYSVAAAEPGNWQMQIIGDTDTVPTEFFVVDLNNTPAPGFTYATVKPGATPNQAEVRWGNSYVAPEINVSIYATDGEITSTLAYTNSDGQLITGESEIFTGIPLVEGLEARIPSPAPFFPLPPYELDLSSLPSGTYALWMQADDGVNPPVRSYLHTDISTDSPVARLVVDHSNSYPSNWNTQIDTDIDIGKGELLAEWDLNMHPDVDSYTVRIRSTHPVTPTTEVLREIEVGLSGPGTRGSTIVDMIEPGWTYYIAIGAADLNDAGETTRIAWSQEVTVVTPQPDFFISTTDAELSVTAGGAPTSLPLTLDLATNLPYPVTLGVDFGRLPDGVDVNFVRDVITPTTASDVTAQITASATMHSGYYVIPIVARSGRLERSLNLSIAVKEASDVPENMQTSYLPLIKR